MLGSEIRFPLQNRREESKRFFPLSFVCRYMRDPAHVTSKRPFQGPGVSAIIRGTARAQRESESRFPLQQQRENLRRFSLCLFCGCSPGVAPHPDAPDAPDVPDIPDSSDALDALDALDSPEMLRAGGAEASRWCFLLSVRSSGPSGRLLRAISAAPTAVPHPCVCGASGRASTPRAP